MDVFIARQPIFNKRKQVFAYELLFRVGNANAYAETDGDRATSNVISDSMLLFGIDTLTRGRKAFINFTRNLLLDETATTLPKDTLVIEILENIAPEKGIVNACRKLKQLGYTLALDDFVFEERYRPLVELADIVKVDYLLSSPDERRNIIDLCKPSNVRFLAEKVETEEDFNEAAGLGYSYFQGYFFSKPDILSTKDIPSGKLSYLNILHELNLPEMDFNRIETAIKRDVSISFKLLKFINSAFFSFPRQIHSIKQALLMLGIVEIRKWVSLIIMKGIGEDKTDELMVTSVVRARICELIGQELNLRERSSDLFFMGMFSLIDTFFSRPMEEMLESLPLAEETKGALLGEAGPFRNILDLVRAYEQADWAKVTAMCDEMKLSHLKLADFYVASIEWANNLVIP